ncbi:MAG: hypothetical protein QMB38_06340 [Ascidiaceihabitans sp.]|jgi:hypothetical protein|tara:strand:+ start:40 stop:249 length:210 start_codon:yes stop_codon:yes gene_type:complete
MTEIKNRALQGAVFSCEALPRARRYSRTEETLRIFVRIENMGSKGQDLDNCDPRNDSYRFASELTSVNV